MTAPLEPWNRALELVEQRLAEDPGAEVDVAALARVTLTSEYHFRRVFSVLAGMPISDYVRRRRLTLAAADLAGGRGSVLDVAIRHGWCSADAFTRAFRAHHGVTPSQARRTGTALRSQPRVTLHLSIRGADPVRHRIEQTDAFRLVGAHARLPLVYEGENTALTDFTAALPPDLDERLLPLADVRGLPAVLSVSSGFEEDRADGSRFDYHHGVATTRPQPDLPGDLDVLEVEPLTWAVFETEGEASGEEFRRDLQQLWAQAFSEWLPANPYELAPGPEILQVLSLPVESGRERVRGELWLPVRPLGG